MNIPNDFNPLGIASGKSLEGTVFLLKIPANVSQKYSLSINSKNTGQCTIDWGDGTFVSWTGQSKSASKTYSTVTSKQPLQLYLTFKGPITSISFGEIQRKQIW